jgi:hypothetical protein
MKLIKLASSLSLNILCDGSEIEFHRRYWKIGEFAGENHHIYLNEPTIRSLITESFRNIYNQFDSSGFENLKRRYSFNVTDVRGSYKDVTFEISFSPLVSGVEELADESDEYAMKFKGGKTGRVLYKEPKDAIESIPEDNRLMYRGMSWEEWQSIRKRGFIQSKGHYNLGQEGLTFFSYSPRSAESYSSGFAHFQNEISVKTPGVVIGVDRGFGLTSNDRDDIPESELAINGRLGINEIEKVWFLIPVSNRKLSKFDLIIPYVQNESDQSIIWNLDPSKSRTGSGVFTLSTNYKILEKK